MEQKLKEMKAREAELEQYPDHMERKNLFRSWIGQADKCLRKGYLQDDYYHALMLAWLDKCEMLLEGKPLEECKGKIKIKGQKPRSKKQRIAWKAERKEEIRAYRREVQRRNNERQKRGESKY